MFSDNEWRKTERVLRLRQAAMSAFCAYLQEDPGSDRREDLLQRALRHAQWADEEVSRE